MRQRIEEMLKSGELAKMAALCPTRSEMLRRLGMTTDQYRAAAITLQRRGTPLPSFVELKIAGLGLQQTQKVAPSEPVLESIDVDLTFDDPAIEWSETETTQPNAPSIDVQLADRAQRSEASATKAQLKAALAALEQCRLELETFTAARDARPEVHTIDAREHSSGLREATAVALASDWHIESCVDADKVNGLNSYNLDIARRRVGRFFAGFSWMTNYHRQAFEIRDGILWLGGDIITGHLREENLETNTLSPVQAISTVHVWIADGIRQYLEQTQLERLKVVCNSGNHGRLTHKVRPSTREDNSIEWLLYAGLAREFANEPRVEFVLPHGVLTYVRVYNWMLRFTHLDACKGGDGVGGIMIPIMKKLAKWDSGIKADVTNGGHFHQYYDLPFLTLNSSLIGLDEYALELGCRPEDPCQAFYLIDKRRGKSMQGRIWAEDSAEREAA